jgi:hypothetical protein
MIEHFKKACKNYVFELEVILLLLIEPLRSKISAF